MKRMNEVFIVFICQIIIAFSIYSILSSISTSITQPLRNNLSWGITLYFIKLAYLVICLITSILMSFSKNLKVVIGILILAQTFFTTLVLSDFQFTPYKVLLVFTSSFFGLVFTSYLIKRMWIMKGKD